MRAFGAQGTADGKFNYPWGITTDSMGFIYVADKENHRIQVSKIKLFSNMMSHKNSLGFSIRRHICGQVWKLRQWGGTACKYPFLNIASHSMKYLRFHVGASSLHRSFQHEPGHRVRLK